ncbi:MAG: alkaline phosphatase family protein [Acidimicrobiia bacterium]
MARRSSPAAQAPRVAVLLTVTAVLAVLAGCGGSSDKVTSSSRPSRLARPTPAVTTTLGPNPDLAAQPCQGRTPPTKYDHVVVILMENRDWAQVGGPGFGGMPYMNGLAKSCAYYEQWDDTNPLQSSLTQYIGITSGIDNPKTVADCNPSGVCYSTDDNIFRQVRLADGSARNFVDGATEPCSVGANAAKHIPALYYRGAYQDSAGSPHNDADFCVNEVLPLLRLDPNNLPTYAFISPTQCNDGHDCDNAAADEFLLNQVGAIIAGDSYKSGKTAVFVMYDEERPTPNMIITPSALPGPRPGKGTHHGALKTMEIMLGLPVIPAVADHQDLRASTPL